MDFRKPRREAARYCRTTWRPVRADARFYDNGWWAFALKGKRAKRPLRVYSTKTMLEDVQAFYRHRVNFYFEEWLLSC